MLRNSIRWGLILVGAAWLLAQPDAGAQPQLFSDNFDADSSANWTVIGGSAGGTPDHTVLFAFDYTTNRFTRNGLTGTIPAAPNGGGKGVKMWVNKNDDLAEVAAVSLFPKDRTFTGSFALKFDMWLNYNGGAGGGAGSTEFATFGINHVGDKAIWDDGVSPSDGVWFAVTGESGAALDYRSYVGDGFSPAIRGLNFVGGFLDRDANGVAEEEVVGTEAPGYPLFLLFPSPQFETAGMPSKQWVEVEVRQRVNDFGAHTVTWLMNNYVIAEHTNGDQVAMTAGTIMLGNMDIFASIANPRPDNYVIYDNVRVVDLSTSAPLPVVTVSATDAEAAEPSNPGTFTINVNGSSAGPLTVNYRLAGTAVNGTDYATLPGSVTINSIQSSAEVTVAPLNDAIGEALETVTLVLLGSTNYDLYTNIAATVNLTDDGDVPGVSVSAVRTNAYEGYAGNAGRFVISLTNPRSAATTVQFQLGGTATVGTDFTSVGTSVVIPAGETNATVSIRPVNNATSQPDLRTVILTLAGGTGYTLGPVTNATVGIRDDDFVPVGTVLYAEDFDTDSTAEWMVNPAGGDNPVDLFFDYSTVGVPSAPNSSGGTTHGARLQANLLSGIFSGVSVSPIDLNLTNDYVLRFDLWQNFNGPFPGGGSGSTQISGGGVGTEGTTPQWPGGAQDSVWFASSGDGGSSVDYRAYSRNAGTGYLDDSGVYAAGGRNESLAYYAEFGRHSAPEAQVAMFPEQTGETLPGAQGLMWRDIVIMKQGTNVTWYIDGKLIATVTDATNLAGGNILLMHSDINASSSVDANASLTAFGLFDNIRVTALPTEVPVTRPDIGGISVTDSGANVQIDFTGAASDTPGAFKVFASATAAGPYVQASATITQVSPGVFRAVLPVNGDRQFYRLAR